jgi:hypothetical protein
MRCVKLAVILLAALFVSTSVICPAPATAAPIQSSAVASGQLDDDKLRQMLDAMGFEPKALSKGFLITIKRDAWTTYIQLVISKDQAKIGLNANLGVVESPDSITAAQWRSVLAANRDIDPSSFYYDVDQKKLYIHRVMDNRAVTPAYLRTQIDNFVDNMKSTEALWSFTK